MSSPGQRSCTSRGRTLASFSNRGTASSPLCDGFSASGRPNGLRPRLRGRHARIAPRPTLCSLPDGKVVQPTEDEGAKAAVDQSVYSPDAWHPGQRAAIGHRRDGILNTSSSDENLLGTIQPPKQGMLRTVHPCSIAKLPDWQWRGPPSAGRYVRSNTERIRIFTPAAKPSSKMKRSALSSRIIARLALAPVRRAVTHQRSSSGESSKPGRLPARGHNPGRSRCWACHNRGHSIR